MKRFVIVFSNEPEDAAPWVARACASAKLKFVDNDPITTEISRIPEAQKQFLQSNLPPGENPALAPHYQAALEKVAGRETRVGLYSLSWLLYLGQADGCVLDFSALESQRKQGLAAGMKQKDVDAYVAKFTQQMRDRASKHVPRERILELPAGEPEARKLELSADFIRKLG
ncbi:hypothetical protein [Hyalangium rubrum]|uniref:Uncharacterized protein n=1 Tax=Hyalangium rubrum TaxID=3103134 RepID=A0ABU5HGC6_9BACT|nr:hypothetical protein [Hyalangium sp. s54d21]MDY7232320.1 hypothetical protein [Hyalangium sp. s54d21]